MSYYYPSVSHVRPAPPYPSVQTSAPRLGPPVLHSQAPSFVPAVLPGWPPYVPAAFPQPSLPILPAAPPQPSLPILPAAPPQPSLPILPAAAPDMTPAWRPCHPQSAGHYVSSGVPSVTVQVQRHYGETRSEILWLCAQKNLLALQQLFQRNGYLRLDVDVENILLKRDRYSVPEYCVKIDSLSCANFVLAVLLLRKLLEKRLLPMTSSIIDMIQNRPPETIISSALQTISPEISCFRFGSTLEIRPYQPLFTMIAAVTVGETFLVRQIWENEFKDRLKQYRSNVRASLCKPLLLITALAGDPEILRVALNIFKNQVTDEVYIIPAVWWHTFRWANSFDDNNFTRLSRDLVRFSQKCCIKEPWYVMSKKVQFILNYVNGRWGALSGDEDVPDWSVFMHNWPFPSLCMLLSLRMGSVGNLALTVHLQCHIALQQHPAEYHPLPPHSYGNFSLDRFKQLCQGGGAGLLLRSLEIGSLNKVPRTHRAFLILYLFQCLRVTASRNKTCSKFMCELCKRPIMSFYLWLQTQSPAPDSCLEPEKIAGYCEDDYLDFFGRLETESNTLCIRHSSIVADGNHVAGIVRKINSSRSNRSLQFHAILAVLQGLGGDCDRLKALGLPPGLKSYFFLSYPECVPADDS